MNQLPSSKSTPESSGYYIFIKQGLLDPKHIVRMQVNKNTTAVWLYLWFLDKITKIDPGTGLGIVWGGKPFKLSDCNLAGVQMLRGMFQQLQKHNYIKTQKTPHGNVVWVTKAYKIFGQKPRDGQAHWVLGHIEKGSDVQARKVLGHIEKGSD